MSHSPPAVEPPGNSLPVAVATLDLGGLVRTWNPAAEALFGWSASKAVGRSIMELIGWGAVEATVDRLRAGDEPRCLTAVHREDGGELSAELAFGALVNGVDELTGLLLLATDMTRSERETQTLRVHDRLLLEAQELALMGSWDWTAASDAITWSALQGHVEGLDAVVRAAVTRTLDAGTAVTLVARVGGPDDEPRWVESLAAPQVTGGTVVRVVGTVRDVTRDHLSQAGQRESEARYRMIIETAREGIWLVDSKAVTTFANERMADILGLPAAELLGTPVDALLSEEGQVIAAERLALLAEGRPQRFDLRFERPDGTAVWTMVSAAPILEDDRYVGALAMLTDVTDRHQAELDLQDSRERLAEAQRLALLGSWTRDLATGVVTCSDQLRELVGIDPETGLTSLDNLMTLVHPDDRRRCEVFDQNVRAGAGSLTEELRMTTPQGHDRWVALRASPVYDPQGRVVRMHGSMQDISERKATEGQLAHLALHDRLTNLPNRSLFGDRLRHALARPSGAVMVMLLDLDGFKGINDNLGQVAGDAILATVASRLRSALRPSDTIARFAGDAFSVLIEDVAVEGAAGAAERLLDTLSPPIVLDGRSVSVQATIGVATGSAVAASADELLRNADTAMQAAKRKGGSRYELFRSQPLTLDVDRLALEGDLRSAALGTEMFLHYQPLVDLHDGRLSGFEALLRWSHPVRGPIGPDQFIPIAESSGVIVPIGRWVLNEACRQLAAWESTRPFPAPLTMNVNVSARQLADPHLVEDVAHALAVSKLDPVLLTMEITETMIMADEEEVGARLRELKRLGVRISVDDFGTGYSSIGHLERFPIDEVKIDRSFVSTLDPDGHDPGVALGVLRLARSLRLDVVAEGIERVEQLAELRRAACDTGQGYYFSKALDPAAVEVLLRQAALFPMPRSSRLVLLVEDEEDVRVSTARVLRSAGFDVVEAETGAEGIRIARGSRLDAAILDVGLPDISGLEVAEALVEMTRGELPIFILTGTAVDVNDRVRGLSLGADAYLTKPVEPRELVAVVGASLRGHGAVPAVSSAQEGTVLEHDRVQAQAPPTQRRK